MTITPKDLEPEQLDNLTGIIATEKCGLVLGPYAQAEEKPGGKRMSLLSLLAREINEDLKTKSGRSCPDHSNLALVCTTYLEQKNTSRALLEIKVRSFFDRYTTPSLLLKEVPRLPFRVVFTTSPDNLLQRAFDQENKRSYRECHYQFSRTQVDNFDQTPPESTYIYQLFGKVFPLPKQPDGSIVLTVEDQLQYLDSVQGVGKETRIPTGLRNAMQECEAFLFLGFDYEDWYLRVLFHVLKFHARAKFIFAMPDGASLDMLPGTEAFFRQQYKVSFFQKNPVHLLQELGRRIASGDSEPRPGQKKRSLLYLHSLEDQPAKERLDKHLSSVKRKFGLAPLSIHDFRAGEEHAVKNAFIDEASVIIMILSADFLADDKLSGEFALRALERISGAVCVAAVFGRQALGVSDFLRGKVQVFPSDTISLDMMQEEAGYAAVAGMIEKQLTASLSNEQ